MQNPQAPEWSPPNKTDWPLSHDEIAAMRAIEPVSKTAYMMACSELQKIARQLGSPLPEELALVPGTVDRIRHILLVILDNAAKIGAP